MTDIVEPIIQPLDKSVYKDTQDISNPKGSERDRFLKKLRNEQTEYTRARKPFCFRCAKIDYENEQERQFKDKGTRTGAKKAEDVKIDLNLKDYADPKRFSFIKKTNIERDILQDGIKTKAVTSIYEDYKCNERGCGHSIEKPVIPKQG